MSNVSIICKAGDVGPGSMKTFMVGGKRIALANVGGEFFAVDDSCTHEQCSLGTDGALDGNIIICGCHGGMFDVTNGSVMAPPPPSPVTTHKIRVENDTVYLEL